MQRLSTTIDDGLNIELDKHKQQALKKILNFKPYKVNQDSVEALHDLREQRTQHVINASRN